MNFLSLTNRVLKAFNETPLTSTTFGSAYGFFAEAQDDVNRAIFDIYTEEDTQWPFAFTTFTFNTVPGVQAYTLDSTCFSYDWDSFYITRPNISVSSIALVGTTVTVNTTLPHQIIVGDAASLYNINDSSGANTYYNASLGGGAVTGWQVVTVPTTTQFTFTVPASSPTPSVTVSSYMQPAYPAQDIDLIDNYTYKNNGLINDINGKAPQAVPYNYNQPANVVREKDNSIILTPIPDRAYTVVYNAFLLPAALVNYNDTCTIPSQFEQVIVDKALHYAYMFRDNIESAGLAEQRYEKNVNKMRRILIPQTEYMRFEG